MEPGDAEGYFDVRALTYNNGDPVPEERRIFRFARPYVALLDAEVSGAFNLLDLTCTRGESVLPCAGVAGVAVYPHRRRSGVGSAMLSWLPGHLRESGIAMTSLYAFRESWYRRFGYEVAGKRLKITCPVGRLPKVSHPLSIRRLRPTDWELLDPCYTAFATARSGLTLRTEKLWQRVLAENRELTIYAAGDPVEAYAVVSHKVDFWSTDHVSDVAWSSPDGYRALMEIFSGIGINKTALTWHEPSDSPFYAQYLDQGISAEIVRPIMYRVCDVPAVLATLRPNSSGAFSLAVRDDQVPQNTGPWHVVYSPDGVTVEPSSSADLEFDIQSFTQAFLGEPSLLDLVSMGRVGVTSPDALASAARLLPALPVTCNDFF